MPRLQRAVDRRFPPHPGSPALLPRIERSLASYVRGQFLLSLIIGTSAGLGMWILGITGLVPGADRYAVLFGAWVAVTEVIPYLGPWLGAIPPIVYALVVHPLSRGLGHAALPRDPPDRGAHRRTERDGQRAAAPSAAGDLRAARGRRDLRARRGAHRAAAAGGRAARSGSSSASASCSSRGGKAGRFRSRSRSRRRGRWRPSRRPRTRPQRPAGELDPAVARRPRGRPQVRQTTRARAGRARGPGGRRRSRSSGPTAPGSRRCSRSWPARSRRASGWSSGARASRVGWAPQRPAQYGRLSARENLELFARLEAEPDPEPAAARLLEDFELPGEAVAEREPLGREPPAPQPRDRVPRRARGAPPRRADGRARPASSGAASGSGSAPCVRRAARSCSRRRTSRRSSAIANHVAALRDGRLVFSGPAEEYDRSQADTLFA